MKVVSAASEDEMIASFVRGGLDSPREREKLLGTLHACGVPEDAVRRLDTDDESLNRARRRVLSDWFAWGNPDKGVFAGLPDDVTWMWVELDQADLVERVFTIRWSFEDEYGFRELAKVAALHGGRALWRSQLAQPVLDAVRAGRMPEPPILVSLPDYERLVILEGHTRLQAYLFDPTVVPFPLKAMVGVSTRIAEWSEW